MAESTLEPPSGFERGIPGLAIQRPKNLIWEIWQRSLENFSSNELLKKGTQLQGFSFEFQTPI